MFQAIFVMLKGTAGVVGWVDKHALHFARIFLFERLERQQIVTKNQLVIEYVVVRYTVFGMEGLVRLFQQNPRLQSGPLVLANPGEFELVSLFSHLSADYPIRALTRCCSCTRSCISV